MVQGIDSEAEHYEIPEELNETSEIIENNDSLIERSKLMYKNRAIAPQRNLIDFIEIKDEHNNIIIPQSWFKQTALNYLCTTEINWEFTDKKVNDLHHKVMNAILDPMHGPFEKKKLLFDWKSILKLFISPVFSGWINPFINQLDFKYVNFLLDRKLNKGIEYKNDFDDEENELIWDYEKLRYRQQRKEIVQGYWRTLDSLLGSAPSSKEGTVIVYDNNKLYLFGGFAREVYNDMKILDINKKKWYTVVPETKYEWPVQRYGHSMVLYQNYLLLFGGAGAFNK